VLLGEGIVGYIIEGSFSWGGPQFFPGTGHHGGESESGEEGSNTMSELC
jgi:hypothetical protein